MSRSSNVTNDPLFWCVSIFVPFCLLLVLARISNQEETVCVSVVLPELSAQIGPGHVPTAGDIIVNETRSLLGRKAREGGPKPQLSYLISLLFKRFFYF